MLFTRFAGAVNYYLRPAYERDQTLVDHAISGFCFAVLSVSLFVIALGLSPERPRSKPHCTPVSCEMPIDWRVTK